MKHRTEKAMWFHFLSCLDYTKSLEEVRLQAGYNFGDYYSEDNAIRTAVRNAVDQMWLLFHDFKDWDKPRVDA